jgi:hypothetical protein
MTITDPTLTPEFGFVRSKESGGWDARSNFRKGDLRLVKAQSAEVAASIPIKKYETLSIPAQPSLGSEDAAIRISEFGFDLSTLSPPVATNP